MKLHKRIIFGLSIVAFFTLSVFAFSHFAYAQDNLADIADTTGLGTTDPRLVVARIIRAGLGVLGMLAVCIVIYAGYLWMTAGGAPDRIEKAKQLLINALIGLIIIFASVAIVQFVINAITRATGGGQFGGGDYGDCVGCIGGSGEVGFVIERFVPQDIVPIRNVVARAYFSRRVDIETLKDHIQVFNAESTAPIDITYSVTGDIVKIVPKEACPSPNEDRFCYPANTKITVQFLAGIRSAGGQDLICRDGVYPCSFSFKTGDLVDVAPPRVDITDPFSGKRFLKSAPLPVQAHATDDAMVSGAEFYAEDELFATEANDGINLRDVLLNTAWDASLYPEGKSYTLRATAFDIADNSASDTVAVYINPAHCGNRIKDADETAIDCGGSCGACTEEACTNDNACATGRCIENKCVAMPVILNVSPAGGAPGTYVLITGTSFGTSAGEVFFQGVTGRIRASVPACSDGWTNTAVLVAVPKDAIDGAIIIRSSSGYEDTTNDGNGPLIVDFDVNDVVRPNLCRITPSIGQPRSIATLSGSGFGDAQEGGFVLFDKDDLYTFSAVRPSEYIAPWASDKVGVRVPTLEQNDYFVTLTQRGVTSNPVPYYVRFSSETGVETDPRIQKIEPNSGGIGTYVTISGVNFGDRLGQVWFENKLDRTQRAQGSVDFPDMCKSEDIWRTDQVIVKVPAKYPNNTSVVPGDFSVSVARADGIASAPVDFAVTDTDPGPGVCAIKPNEGKEGTNATVYGERFGPRGAVEFTEGALTTIKNWTDKVIDIVIPRGKSGLVYVSTGDDIRSQQGVYFSYGTGQQAPSTTGPRQGGYGWRFSTGVIPEVPGVIIACNDTVRSAIPNNAFNETVCRNVRIYVAFTAEMNPVTLSFGNTVNVYTCPDTKPCKASDRQKVEGGSLSFNPEGQGLDAEEGGVRAMFITPSTTDRLLLASKRYRVEIKGGNGGAQSLTGEELPQTVGWDFVTGDEQNLCAVDEVFVQPTTSVINVEGGTQGFTAGGFAQRCLWLSNDFDWNWSSNTAVATLQENACVPALDFDSDACVVATAVGDGQTPVTAREGESNKSNDATLHVSFADPYVVATWPACKDACENAEIGMRFNVPMKTTTKFGIFHAGTVGVAKCENELCAFTGPAQGIAECTQSVTMPNGEPGCTQLKISGVQLVKDTFYKAFVSKQIRSTSEKPLTRLNDSIGYSWIFSTSKEGGACAVNSVLVEPGTAIARHIDARQSFTATPLSEPDHCSVSGQRLDAIDYNWQWENPIVDRAQVAEWMTVGGQLFNVSLNTDIQGCTTRCLSVGSSVYTSVCGNGIKEAGEACEDGNYQDGDGCSSVCLRESRSARFSLAGTCGDGVLQNINFETDTETRTFEFIGEECDDRNQNNGDGCSSSCMNEGSQYVGSICGNNDLAYSANVGGEGCDDGNRQNGDGCSAVCLLEGSTSPLIHPAVCGDGIINIPYETCDDDNLANGDGCSAECLREGATASVYRTRCGNGNIDRDLITGAGEDCDGGDGCSQACLSQGSSLTYQSPSICGDGIVGFGEHDACENTSTSDRFTDASQIARISEDAPAQIRANDITVSSTIRTQAEGYRVSGQATYTLQCGAITDSDCGKSDELGVGVGGCCAMRPVIQSHAPHGSNVCRNILPSFVVNTEIDIKSAKENSYLIYRGNQSCGTLSGHTQIARVEDKEHRPLLAMGRRIMSILIPVIHAQTVGDCIVPIKQVVQERAGESYQTSLLTGVLFAPNAQYELVVKGDNVLDDRNPQGLQSALGVRMLRDYAPSDRFFTTGTEICALDYVEVHDPDGNPEGLFTVSGTDGAREFTALPFALHGGRAQALQPIADIYTWSWKEWADDREERIVKVDAFTDDTAISRATIIPQEENGESVVTAILETAGSSAEKICAGGEKGGNACTTDAMCPASSCIYKTVHGSLAVETFFCENPWPSMATFPYEDKQGNNDGIVAGTGPTSEWTQFSTFYCRDAGKKGIEDDLPSLRSIQPPVLPELSNIQKEFLFEVTGEEYRGDVIGLRVISNSSYLSPEEWYASQGFEGSPSTFSVDGFKAVRDGRTVYLAGAREKNDVLRSNIYILSYNQDAKEETRAIFEALINNFHLLIDLEQGSRTCEGDGVEGKTCVSDIDCGGAGVCLDGKGKIARDMQRLTDVNRMARSIETYAVEHGVCSATTTKTCRVNADCPQSEVCRPAIPALPSGTFIAGMTASTWPSWQEVFGSTISGVSIDPINKYVSDIAGKATCPPGGLDNATCYNEPTRTYVCEEGSHVYHYTRETNSTTKQYRLIASLEYRDAVWEHAIPNYPLGIVEVDVNRQTQGTLASGFVRNPQYCNGSVRGGSTICGDGIVGAREVCEKDQVTGGEACLTDSGQIGQKQQRCNATCSAFENDTNAPCIPLACGNGTIEPGELCDDGAENGKYGFCSSTCQYSNAPRCGDSRLDAGEACDCGFANDGLASGRSMDGSVCGASVYNGSYTDKSGAGCSWDCRGPASYCGDLVQNGAEACDGTARTWAGDICIDGSPCTTGETCSDGTACGRRGLTACKAARVCLAGDNTKIGISCKEDADCGSIVSGVNQGDGQCSPQFIERTRTRACGGPLSQNACTFDRRWSDCMPATTCGNGAVEQGEECDDGNRENGDTCTNVCRLNVCGDRHVFQGVEACDNGASNGTVCDATYDATCTYCSNTCTLVARSGSYCGDGYRQRPAELCDGQEMPYQRISRTGKVGPVCEDVGENTQLNGESAVCARAGLCNGGVRNGKTCLTGDYGTDFSGLNCTEGGGICVLPQCNANCLGMCPFQYDRQPLTFTSQFEGASRQESITLIKESVNRNPLDIRRPSARGVLHIPACRQAGDIVGNVAFTINRPQKAYVMFVNDLSGSMMATVPGGQGGSITRLGLLKTTLTNTITTLFNELGEDVKIGMTTYGASVENLAYTNMTSLRNVEDFGIEGYASGKTYDDLLPDGGRLIGRGQVSQFYSMTERTVLQRMVAGFFARFCRGTNIITACTTEADCGGVEGSCPNPGTSTSIGMLHALYAFDEHVDPEESARRIIVLMTDGDFDLNYSPSYLSCIAKKKGYEVYTIRLGESGRPTLSPYTPEPMDCGTLLGTNDQFLDYTAWSGQIGDPGTNTCRALLASQDNGGWDSATKLNHLSCISSGNPDTTNGLTYVYSGSTVSEFTDAFSQITASIANAIIRYTVPTGSGFTEVHGTIVEGNGVSIPYPTGFACNPRAEQSIPVEISFFGEGTVTLSNFQFNYCKP